MNDSNTASILSDDRPFEGDTLIQTPNEWVIREVGGWGDIGLWSVTLSDTQPASAAGLAGPVITLRRYTANPGQLRIDFTNGQAGDEVFARLMRADGRLRGVEYRNTLTGADNQLVIKEGVQDGDSVAVWIRRRPNRASARTVMGVPDAT